MAADECRKNDKYEKLLNIEDIIR